MRTPQFSELKTARERVHLLLKEIPKLRESDDDLIATYIFKEVGEDIKEMTKNMNSYGKNFQEFCKDLEVQIEQM